MKKLGEGNKGLNPYFAPFAKLLKNSFSPLIPFFFIPMSFLPYKYRCADQPGAGTMGKKGKRGRPSLRAPYTAACGRHPASDWNGSGLSCGYSDRIACDKRCGGVLALCFKHGVKPSV